MTLGGQFILLEDDLIYQTVLPFSSWFRHCRRRYRMDLEKTNAAVETLLSKSHLKKQLPQVRLYWKPLDTASSISIRLCPLMTSQSIPSPFK
jgi:hypothetical protein